jgi:hypothetical protein
VCNHSPPGVSKREVGWGDFSREEVAAAFSQELWILAGRSAGRYEITLPRGQNRKVGAGGFSWKKSNARQPHPGEQAVLDYGTQSHKHREMCCTKVNTLTAGDDIKVNLDHETLDVWAGQSLHGFQRSQLLVDYRR